MAEPTDTWSLPIALDSGEVGTLSIRHEAGKDADVLRVLHYLTESVILNRELGLLQNPLSHDAFLVDIPDASTRGPVFVEVKGVSGGVDEFQEVMVLLTERESNAAVGSAMEYSINRDFDGTTEFMDDVFSEVVGMGLELSGGLPQ